VSTSNTNSKNSKDELDALDLQPSIENAVNLKTASSASSYLRRELIRRLKLTRNIGLVLMVALLGSAIFSLVRLIATLSAGTGTAGSDNSNPNSLSWSSSFFLIVSTVCVVMFLTSALFAHWGLRVLSRSGSGFGIGNTLKTSNTGAFTSFHTQAGEGGEGKRKSEGEEGGEEENENGSSTATGISAKAKKRADIAGLLMVITITLTATFTQLYYPTDDGSLTSGFLILPVVAALLGLSRRLTLVGALGGGLALVVSYVASRAALTNSVGLATGALTWVGAYAVIAVCILLFTGQVSRANYQEQLERRRSGRLLAALTDSTLVSRQLSGDLSAATSELNYVAREQAANSQDHATALSEVTTSMEELGETSAQIALNTVAVAQAASSSLRMANEVQQESGRAQTFSREGAEAVKQVLLSQEKLKERVEVMAQRLLMLTQNIQKVGSIVTLIEEIADETQLLALNAGIEAAGTIEIEPDYYATTVVTPAVNNDNRNSFSPSPSPSLSLSLGTAAVGAGAVNGVATTATATATATATVVMRSGSGRSRQGERFAVIAQEVKSLADRSREATEEIRDIVGEIKGAVAAAVLVAEEVKKDATNSTARSTIAGAVIEKLNVVVEQSALQASQIVQIAHEVTSRCEEISIATRQQQSASGQVLDSLRSLKDISQQTVGAISQLVATVGQVNRRVGELGEVLVIATSSASISEDDRDDSDDNNYSATFPTAFSTKAVSNGGGGGVL
jgi:methyl-accepting chemotaxis protein